MDSDQLSKSLTFHHVMMAGGLDPLHLQVISYLRPALKSRFSPTRSTSNGLKYISTATRTTSGGWTPLLLTSQLYTASRSDRFNVTSFSTLCDFRRSGKCCVSSVTVFPSRDQVMRGKGLPPLAMQVRVRLAPSAYGDVRPFLMGPLSSFTWTPSGGTAKENILNATVSNLTTYQ